jgi:hypothetical protein
MLGRGQIACTRFKSSIKKKRARKGCSPNLALLTMQIKYKQGVKLL